MPDSNLHTPHFLGAGVEGEHQWTSLSHKFQNLSNHSRIFHARHDPGRPGTLLTGFTLDLEHPFQALGFYPDFTDTSKKPHRRYPKLLANLAKVDVLILDDWGLVKPNAENRRDLLEVLEDRHGLRSTIVTSQLPVEEWHAVIGDPTLADAILDRLVHNAYKINLRGESLRKQKTKLTADTDSE